MSEGTGPVPVPLTHVRSCQPTLRQAQVVSAYAQCSKPGLLTKNPSLSSRRQMAGLSLLNAFRFWVDSIPARPHRSFQAGPFVAVRVSARRPKLALPSPSLSVKSWAHWSPEDTWLTPPGKPPLSWVEAMAYSSQSIVPTEASARCAAQLLGQTLSRLSSDVHGLPSGRVAVVSGPR